MGVVCGGLLFHGAGTVGADTLLVGRVASGLGLCCWALGIKTKEPGQLALLRLHKGRLPTLPLSQYHRRGEA